jgi:endonuclease/exonuclease/phosphatase family metal-dependent hydrolase
MQGWTKAYASTSSDPSSVWATQSQAPSGKKAPDKANNSKVAEQASKLCKNLTNYGAAICKFTAQHIMNRRGHGSAEKTHMLVCSYNMGSKEDWKNTFESYEKTQQHSKNELNGLYKDVQKSVAKKFANDGGVFLFQESAIVKESSADMRIGKHHRIQKLRDSEKSLNVDIKQLKSDIARLEVEKTSFEEMLQKASPDSPSINQISELIEFTSATIQSKKEQIEQKTTASKKIKENIIDLANERILNSRNIFHERAELRELKNAGYEFFCLDNRKGAPMRSIDTLIALPPGRFEKIENKSFFDRSTNSDVAFVIATDKQTGKKLAFISAHLPGIDFAGKADAKSDSGIKAAEAIVAKVKEECSDCDGIIFGGDLNTPEKYYAHRHDALREGGFEIHGSGKATNRTTDEMYLKSNRNPNEELDYFGVKSPNGKLKASVTVLSDKTSSGFDHKLDASDHKPIYMDMAFKLARV